MLVGLEIEPSGIHAAAVEVNGKISIQHAATAQLEAGIVRDGEVTDVDGLADALRKLFDENRDLDKRVRIGVANQKVVVRVMELPPIADRKELDAAVRFRAQDEVAMPLDSAVMDYQPLDIIDTPDGPRQRILIVAARRDMVERVLAAARAAGLRPEGIDLAAFAMVRALHRSGRAGEQVLYLSIGGLTNLAVAQGPMCLFTRVVGGGLESIADRACRAPLLSRSSTPAAGSPTSASSATWPRSTATRRSSPMPASSSPRASVASPRTCAAHWTSFRPTVKRRGLHAPS